MTNEEIKANVKRLHAKESELLAQIKNVRKEKKKFIQLWYEQYVNHQEETPLEREVKAAKK